MAQGGTKVILQAIGGNTFITIIKFIGFFLTRSPSMMAEAVHSLADTFNQILLFIGIKQSSSDGSSEYSTGMGGASYVWNLVSAVGIFFLGFGITFYHGMHSLLSENHAVPEVSWLAIGILVLSFVIEFWVLIGAYKEAKSQMGKKSFIQFFRESDNPALLAVLLEDGIAVLGVVLALIGVGLGQVTGSALFDAIVSLVISFLLAFLAIALGIINGKLLIGKRVTPIKEQEIQAFIESLPQVDHVQSLTTKIIGSGSIRLSVEIELHGENLIDTETLKADILKLEQGEAPAKVLTKVSERMIRIAGSTINKIETKITERFPEISIIDFEIN